jgi:26S proteasome regulatory subunit N2
LCTEIYDDLRDVLYHDSAIAGEAAGYAMGLLMLGSGSSKALDEMLQYAHETQHEKIIRGLAVGISLLFYGKEQAADGIIEILTADKVCFPLINFSPRHTSPCFISSTGSHSPIWRDLYNRDGLRRYREQQGD